MPLSTLLSTYLMRMFSEGIMVSSKPPLGEITRSSVRTGGPVFRYVRVNDVCPINLQGKPNKAGSLSYSGSMDLHESPHL